VALALTSFVASLEKYQEGTTVKITFIELVVGRT
jgi:hypothetical protein